MVMLFVVLLWHSGAVVLLPRYARVNVMAQAIAKAAQAAAPARYAQVANTAKLAPTGKAYNARCQHNANSWAAMQACITAHKGTPTKAQLVAALAAVNNPGFVRYLYSNGYLTVAS